MLAKASQMKSMHRLLQALDTEKRAGERNGVISAAMQESTLESALSMAYTLSPANSLPTVVHNSGTSTYTPAHTSFTASSRSHRMPRPCLMPAIPLLRQRILMIVSSVLSYKVNQRTFGCQQGPARS